VDVLVTSATGRLGRPLVAELLERGHRVRALTRDPDSAAAAALARRGAESVGGDFDRPEALRPALRGADAVFLATSPHHGVGPVVEAARAAALADAARAAGVPYLVYGSAAGADQRGDVPILASKRRVEDHLRGLGTPHAVLAPVFFMDNLHYPWNAAVLAAGRWPVPLPAGRRVQVVSVADVAAVAARMIERPAEFAGLRVEVAADELSGPEAAAIMASVLGHPVEDGPAVPPELAGMVPLFRWIADVGFHADLADLRRRFPDITWTGFAAWAADQDWTTARRRAG
jgi:uncharacterized protein YbjT (DUF2867 family)